MTGGLYRVTVPGWLSRDGTARGGFTVDVPLVAKLPGGEIPDPELIERFYGVGAPRSVYCATSADRLIFERGPDDYLIVPDVPRNANLWRPL